ncbi:MAG: SoxR reducing system RseC family protein [Dechloromonas sp.]|nr:MAG: SoxR reducing system RseC family protein [Dechloromonas sp.]
MRPWKRKAGKADEREDDRTQRRRPARRGQQGAGRHRDCRLCFPGQGSSCGIGKMAAGRPATVLTIPVSGNVKVGDFVLIGLPESKLTLSALLGYLFPPRHAARCLARRQHRGGQRCGHRAGRHCRFRRRPRNCPHRHRHGAEPDAGAATDSSPIPIQCFPKEHYHD